MILLGCFRGGDIEPGTFHANNVQTSNLSGSRNDSEDNKGMPDQEEQAEVTDNRRYPENDIC